MIEYINLIILNTLVQYEHSVLEQHIKNYLLGEPAEIVTNQSLINPRTKNVLMDVIKVSNIG